MKDKIFYNMNILYDQIYFTGFLEINLSYKGDESTINSITELIVESQIDNGYGRSTDISLSQADLKFNIKTYDADFSRFYDFENYNITVRWLESIQYEEVINVTKSK